MTPYELMFIVRPDVENEEAVDQQIERYGSLIVDRGGEVTGVDKWGRRRFAYELKGFTEGYYVVLQFKADSATVDELDRLIRISDDILRHIVVRLDEEVEAVASEEDKPEEESVSEESAPEPVAEPDETETAAT